MVSRVRRATLAGTPRVVDLLANYSATPGAEPPVGGPAGATWQRVFTEDFGQANAAALLSPGTWRAGWFGGTADISGPVNSTETARYDAQLLTVGGGQATMPVKLDTANRAGGVKPNLGCQLNTDPNQTTPGFTMSYGYAEARLQQAAGNTTEKLWPGFWLNGNNWPTQMEIDILEGDGTDAGCGFNIHYGTTVGVDSTNLNAVGRLRTVNGATSGMHTYAAYIQPTGVTFYYDGVSVYTYTGSVPNAQRYLMIGNSTAGTLTTQKTMVVDYVRAWTRTN